MIRLLMVFMAMGGFLAVYGLLEKTVPEKVWDKLAHMFRFD